MKLSYTLCFTLLLNSVFGNRVSRASDDVEFSYDIPCGVSNYTEGEKIVGGQNAKPGEFPWLISLQIKIRDSFKHNCGGTVIHKDFILTAGHCTADIPADNLRVAAGKYKLNKEEENQQIRSVQKIYTDSYDGESYGNDIAILKLNESLELKQGIVGPACIPTGNENFGDSRIAAGWGATKDTKTSNILQVVELSKYDIDKCKEKLEDKGYDYFIHPCQICTLTPNKDTCQGDSGGPLLCINKDDNKPYVCGVASFGIGCAQENSPSVYTQVTCFKKWIYNTITGQ